jgi:16S rRNA (guanine527-N7)-methyltransferase
MTNNGAIAIRRVDTYNYIRQYASQFETYYTMLVEHNQRYNLTAIVERSDVYRKHFEDSILGVDLVPHGARLLDIGCGAGFPSLPLVIVRPDLQAWLYDSTAKKVNFCNMVIQSINIGDRATAIHNRIEDVTQRECYDVAVVRAVSKLSTLVEYALPYLKVGGLLLAYKSINIEQELQDARNALDKLHGSIIATNQYQLDDDTQRIIVIVRKDKITDPRYPRKGAKPHTNPL